jgi:hypothetical protein
MIPIYFPYTYVTDSVARALSACFGHFIVYRPLRDDLPEQMQPWLDRGLMEVRVPVSGNEKALKRAVKNFQAWADIHKDSGSEKSIILKTRLESMPLFGELSSSKIVGDLKGNIQGEARGDISDPVMAARIFLYFAQEFDRQNHELRNELIRYDQQEGELFRQLKAEDDPVAESLKATPNLSQDPFADYLTSDRLEAWTHLFNRDPDATGLFVTHRRTIVEQLGETIPSVTRAMGPIAIPVECEDNGERKSWQKNLASQLIRLIEKKRIDPETLPLEDSNRSSTKNNVSLSTYMVSDLTPHQLFAQCTGINLPAADRSALPNNIRNTLVALIEI